MKDDTPFGLMLVGGPGNAPGKDFLEIVRRAVSAGVDAVQVRDRALTGKYLYELAAALQRTAGARARILINDRADVARAADAAGVHLPGSGLPVGEARQLMGPDRLIGCSVHGRDEAGEAERAGADYVIFGPVYETASKQPYGPPQGIGKLRETAAAVRVPVYAIGGITPARAAEVRAAGAAGMAVMSYILDHPGPEAGVRMLIEKWDRG